MAVKAKHHFTPEQIHAGIMCLCDPIGFAYHATGSDLRVPATRNDLPKHWHNKIIMTHEQRMMALDGANVALYRWRRPELAQGSHRIMMRTARKTGKTTFGYKLRYMWYSVIHPRGKRAEALLHAPGQHHMSPTENQLWSTIVGSKLLSSMFMDRNQDDGIWRWKTGLIWHHRIEGSSVQQAGRAMVGLAVVYSLGDEGGYSSTGAYAERKQVTLPDAIEFWGGVPRPGETGMFKVLADRSRAEMEAGIKPQWSFHGNPSRRDSNLWKRKVRYSILVNALYHSDEAIKLQLGTDTWDSDIVMTQICGMDGEAGETAFPTVPTAAVPFYSCFLTNNDVISGVSDSLLSSIDWGQVSADEWGIFSDYGFSPSPMEVIVAYKIQDIWYEMARITAMRCDTHDAARIIYVIDNSLPVPASRIVIDSHGQGRGLMDTLLKHPSYTASNFAERVYPANFHTSIDDERVTLHKLCQTPVRKIEDSALYYCETCDNYVGKDAVKPLSVQAKQLLTSDLIEAFQYASRRLSGNESEDGKWGLVLAIEDDELVRELHGTVALRRANGVSFVPPEDMEHRTDALRCLAMGNRVTERITATHARNRAVLDEYGPFEVQPLYSSERYNPLSGSDFLWTGWRGGRR